MAITKLMHMKEAPGTPHRHLANAISYILDEKNEEAKTEHGLFVGGNAGYDTAGILKTFLETKELYGKKHGRQGYHFVLSFEPGETDAQEAYAITKEFTEKYLGDNYDYVFAVHTDKNHIHSHIIFNSVSRTDGYKYRYEKGDWEKYIQPITDSICLSHGLKPLQFVSDEKIGVSYAEWNEKKQKQISWTQIIRADVDMAVMNADTLSEFVSLMHKSGYSIRQGMSQKRNASYYTFTYTDENGKCHRRRSYNMPQGYSPKDIAVRIKSKSGSRYYEKIAEQMETKAASFKPSEVMKNTRTLKRLYQVVSYYKLPNPYAIPDYKVRKDIVCIDRLLEECSYIKNMGLKDYDDIVNKEKQLDGQITELSGRRKRANVLKYNLTDEEKDKIKKLYEIKRKLESGQINDEEYEKLQDESESIEHEIPEVQSNDELQSLNKTIRTLRKELRLVRRIKSSEQTGKTDKKEVVHVPESGTYDNKKNITEQTRRL